MHDTMVLDHWRDFDLGYAAYARLQFGHAVRQAHRIVTPSNHSKSRIKKYWPFADVQVIPWPCPGEVTAHPLKERQAQVLVVASADRHKRLPLAVEVLSQVRESGIKIDLHFVVRAGNGMRDFQETVNAADPESHWIKVHENLEQDELESLYRDSYCLMVPSLDEGYCLPAIEAARHGTPVVHADRGALPEVVPIGDGGRREGEDDADLLARRLKAVLSPLTWTAQSVSVQSAATARSQTTFVEEWNRLVESTLR
ncbi:glycosyltransferase [Sinomonas sp. R1AF57]|uniref:glycosyltransferase n=1 Tax=Sinomonas sp. R1AF57 TaxID=2020377 RepID=UPI001ABF57E0|nr:glycosyltransferase [Sinomonas sp. R1AF57]